MTRRRIVVFVLVVVAIVAAIVAVYALRGRPDPTSPTSFVPSTWQRAREVRGHAVHVGRAKLDCSECHTKGFEEPPSLEACARSGCHATQADRAHRGSVANPTTCLTCHAFGAGAKIAPCVECHQKNDRLAHHASEAATCGTCHGLHREKGARTAVPDCRGCHAVGASHGRFEAARVAIDADAAVRQFAAAASEVRHDATTFDPKPAQLGHVCTTCHAPHSAAKDAVATCEGCHSRGAANAPQVAAHAEGAPGHETCITCHAPHDARKASVRACDGCHTGKVALGAPRVSEHARCQSCHDPHRPERSAASSCAECHARVSPTHPPTARATTHGASPTGESCIGCHEPHPRRPAEVVASCTTCHENAKDDRAMHRGALSCIQCHTPHAFDLRGRGSTTCATCHAPIVTAARKGHATCISCHGSAHEPTKAPRCATCHAMEAKTAPSGHARCEGCHEAHSGSLGTRVDCRSCHAGKAKELHGSIANGCANCHRPHGPSGPASPPACTTCHAPAKLPGLHVVSAHVKDCASCHGGHSAPKSDRATCTTGCHQDRRRHQPDAAVCKGCHLFRR